MGKSLWYKFSANMWAIGHGNYLRGRLCILNNRTGLPIRALLKRHWAAGRLCTLWNLHFQLSFSTSDCSVHTRSFVCLAESAAYIEATMNLWHCTSIRSWTQVNVINVISLHISGMYTVQQGKTGVRLSKVQYIQSKTEGSKPHIRCIAMNIGAHPSATISERTPVQLYRSAHQCN